MFDFVAESNFEYKIKHLELIATTVSTFKLVSSLFKKERLLQLLQPLLPYFSLLYYMFFSKIKVKTFTNTSQPTHFFVCHCTQSAAAPHMFWFQIVPG